MVEKRCCCPFVSPRRRHNKQEGILLKRRHKLSFAAASGAGGNAWTWGRGWWHKGCPHAQGHRVVSPHPAHGSISSGLVTPPRCRTPRLSLSPGTVLLPAASYSMHAGDLTRGNSPCRVLRTHRWHRPSRACGFALAKGEGDGEGPAAFSSRSL